MIKVPSRTMDCRVHTVLTGQVNACRDRDVAEANERVGSMLIERGGEVLWRIVPEYTRHVDEVIKLFPDSIVNIIRYPSVGWTVYIRHDAIVAEGMGPTCALAAVSAAVDYFRKKNG